ncbi:MAG TPA: DUF2336 domain-containing protein [Xanthobacteraceae bacterium]|nr:DUF2336 domain-containing protein [Xanthobacteraceae bacterium]
MTVLASMIPELEDVVKHGSAAKRAETLRRIAELFIDGASRFEEEHVGLFDEVLSSLIVEIEAKTLAELARRIAPIGNAPLGVIRRLALNDDISVAGPVLQQSQRLDETELLDIARTKGQGHLLAISGRAEVGMALTDLLVGRGDGDVVRNMARNPGARFSEGGLSALMKRAERDDVLAERIGKRPDIPPQMFRNLLVRATTVVQQRLLATALPDARPEIERILAEVSKDIGLKNAAVCDFSAAQRTVLAMHRKGELAEPQLVAFAKSGRYEETVATLSALCAVPIAVIERLMGGDRADPVLILCKAVGFEWPTVRAVIQVRTIGRRASAQALDSAFANFERLSFATAQRVLRFWQVRPENPQPAG